MHDQPKYVPLRASTFFADGSSARLPVPGTVARDHLRDDVLLYTGRVDDQPSPVFPFVVDEGVMSRGRDRFDGMVVQRGYARPPSLLENRLRTAPPGRFFDVMTNGLGTMPDYAAQIPARDRWAIAAYIRALQLAGSATIADVPQAERVRLEGLAR